MAKKKKKDIETMIDELELADGEEVSEETFAEFSNGKGDDNEQQ